MPQLSRFHQQQHSLKLCGEHLPQLLWREAADSGGTEGTDAEGVDPHVLEEGACVLAVQTVVLADSVNAPLRCLAQLTEHVVKGGRHAMLLHEQELVELGFL